MHQADDGQFEKPAGPLKILLFWLGDNVAAGLAEADTDPLPPGPCVRCSRFLNGNTQEFWVKPFAEREDLPVGFRICPDCFQWVTPGGEDGEYLPFMEMTMREAQTSAR